MTTVPEKIYATMAAALMAVSPLCAVSQDLASCCETQCGDSSCPPRCCPPTCNQGPYCCGPNCLPAPYCAEFNIFAEGVYWRADLAGLETAFGSTDVTTTVDPVTSFITTTITESDKQPNFQWRPGFRVGGDYAFGCFDIGTAWTHYNGRAHFRDGEQHGRWNIRYDTIDLTFGRRCCVAPCFYFLPFVGLRGLYVYQSLHSDLEATFTAGVVGNNTVFTEKSDKETFWGLGPELGVEADWYLGCNFSLYASFDFVTYYGNIKGEYNQTDVFPLTTSVSHDRASHRFTTIGTDGAVGIRWDKAWPVASEVLLTLKAGLEQHRIYEFSDIASDGTLSLDGPVFMISGGYRY
jgi:hypothetical protein